ncbi:MAG TPA: cytochrome c [Chthoniobacterales bacterium]|jgi:mono/diheme cytochrome c family protein|nr:cytochrome c [Chthoniobacterales bacterium]
MLRAFFLIFFLVLIAGVAVFGFRGQKSTKPEIEIFPDMVRQPKVRAQTESNFFADQRGGRQPVEGTVPIGYDMPMASDEGTAVDEKGEDAMHPRLGFSEGTDYYNTGKMGANWGTGIPIPVTPALMARGRQRFNINCMPCHGELAEGDGIVKQYGLATVVSLQDDRIRKMADGEIFNTITFGKNTMNPYGPRVVVHDRWAIICYLRALERSQHAAAADVPADHQADLTSKGVPAKK